MSTRTTLILDDDSRAAAQQLAAHFECSVSEAIRRAVIMQRDEALAIDPATRSRRLETLGQLFELFSENDARSEVARLKLEDDGF